VKIGIEGTGTYGAGLTRYLAAEKIVLVEVDRPDRKTRRAKGKSDPIDAIAAARAALSGQANGAPKTRIGPVEAIRALRVARRGAVKARLTHQTGPRQEGNHSMPKALHRPRSPRSATRRLQDPQLSIKLLYSGT
jgi:transposase